MMGTAILHHGGSLAEVVTRETGQSVLQLQCAAESAMMGTASLHHSGSLAEVVTYF